MWIQNEDLWNISSQEAKHHSNSISHLLSWRRSGSSRVNHLAERYRPAQWLGNKTVSSISATDQRTMRKELKGDSAVPTTVAVTSQLSDIRLWWDKLQRSKSKACQCFTVCKMMYQTKVVFNILYLYGQHMYSVGQLYGFLLLLLVEISWTRDFLIHPRKSHCRETYWHYRWGHKHKL